MGLPWARTDVGIFRSPKFAVLRKRGEWRAVAAAVAGQLYSVEHDTGGFLSHDVLEEVYARTRDAQQLVDVGLWHDAPGGYAIHGFAEYQEAGQDASNGAQFASVIRWSCSKGKHKQCKLPGCTCDCHQEEP